MVLKINYDTVNLQKVTYDVVKIMLLKIHHQNGVENFFHFQAPPLAKSWLGSWAVSLWKILKPLNRDDIQKLLDDIINGFTWWSELWPRLVEPTILDGTKIKWCFFQQNAGRLSAIFLKQTWAEL